MTLLYALYHSSCLFCLSLLAMALFACHFDLIVSSLDFISSLCDLGGSLTIDMNSGDTPNFSASAFLLFLTGSSSLSLLISLISSGCKWYFLPSTVLLLTNTGGANLLSCLSFSWYFKCLMYSLLGSSFGMNPSGIVSILVDPMGEDCALLRYKPGSSNLCAFR